MKRYIIEMTNDFIKRLEDTDADAALELFKLRNDYISGADKGVISEITIINKLFYILQDANI